ncbi:DUF2141 domain-containing protein [Calothrix sp. 336/3]|nr:hypothetical protein IJ00_18925 [Calothrix sp. 336/3]
MVRLSTFSFFILSSIASLSLASIVKSEPTANLTVLVKNIKHQTGQICLRIYSGEQGFPSGNKSEVQSGCTKISGSSVSKKFTGLKPGHYAVAVIDDQNGDFKLNRDIFGIPQEGFGLSKNPKVSIQTGTPAFKDASFYLDQNMTVTIIMKYRLDS